MSEGKVRVWRCSRNSELMESVLQPCDKCVPYVPESLLDTDAQDRIAELESSLTELREAAEAMAAVGDRLIFHGRIDSRGGADALDDATRKFREKAAALTDSQEAGK